MLTMATAACVQETYRGGIVPALSLPGVRIDLDTLLDG
jgi:hypothetical protein